jgi:hypothetical protein
LFAVAVAPLVAPVVKQALAAEQKLVEEEEAAVLFAKE